MPPATAAALRVGEMLGGGVEHGAVSAEMRRDDDDRGDHEDVDHDVFHERDHRRRAQAARVGVQREDHERDDQRDLAAGVRIDVAESHRGEHHLHADELQRDVRHRRQHAGEGDGEREPMAAVAGFDEIRCRHVVVLVAHVPQPRHDQEHQRIHDDRVRQREESVRADGEHQRRHRDDGVGRIDVAADQEPGDDGAEAASAQTPFVQLREIGLLPARGDESEHRHQHEEEREDDPRGDVDHGLRRRVHAFFSPTISSHPDRRSRSGWM